MFGVAWLTIPLLLGFFTALLSIVRLVYSLFFSDSAKWKSMNDWLVAKQAQYKAEWDRLRASYTRIDQEAPKAGQDLVDELNKKFPKRRLWRRLWVLVLALGLGGCPLHVVQESKLPMPQRPAIQFVLKDGAVCLPQSDADLLLKYFDKLDAFDASRNRLAE